MTLHIRGVFNDLNRMVLMNSIVINSPLADAFDDLVGCRARSLTFVLTVELISHAIADCTDGRLKRLLEVG